MMNKNPGIIFVLATLLLFSSCQRDVGDPGVPGTESKANTSPAIRISADETDAAEPAIAADVEGNIYVVYVEHSPGKSADVYLQKFDRELRPLGQKVRVNPEIGQAKAWFGDPPTIKAGSGGSVYVGWTATDQSAKKSAATLLYLSVSGDGGKTFAAPVRVNDDTAPAAHGMHSLEIDKDDRIFMAWLDERNVRTAGHLPKASETEKFQVVKAFHDSAAKPGEHNGDHKKTEEPDKSEAHDEMAEPNSEVFFAVSADGGKSFSPNIRLAGEVCPCCKTNLTVDQSGKIYAGWRQVLPGDFRHIAVASSENGGQSFSAPVIVSDDQWQINACPISGPMLVTGPGRAVDVVWFSAGKAGPAGLLTARSDDGGKTFASRRLLFEGAVAGTAAGIAENGAKRAFFGASGKLFKVRLEAPADAASELGDGELPAAVSFNGHSFVCFIKKVDGRRAIWLLKV